MRWLVVAAVLVSAVSSALLPDDCQLLPKWPLPGWWDPQSSTCCTWFGVTCDPTNKFITDLSLQNVMIPLELPEAWANLSQIAFIAFGDAPKLTGTLPAQWGRLDQLEALYIFRTGISGTLPPEWSGMTSMQDLELHDNALTGTLPPEWASMTSMQDLEINGNALTGTLPPEWSSMTSVRFLWLEFNALTGTLPPEWGSMALLKDLRLFSNKLTGLLPAVWGSLTSMVSLALNNNTLFGAIPAEWSTMKALQMLMLSENSLTGVLPSSFATLQALMYFSVQDNLLSGSLPAEWSAMKKLQLLNVAINNISGTLPGLWSTLVNLQQLSFYRNAITGTLPAEWSSLINVFFLDMGSNWISGTLPSAWSALSRLQVLILQRNRLEGTLPAEWAQLQSVEQLSLSSNMLTGTLPSQWSSLTSCTQLGLSTNRLAGTLPPEWKSMSAMSELMLDSNMLVGTLPGAWSLLASLKFFSVSYNSLEGTLPSEWSSLGQLVTLLLPYNMFIGTLPAEWRLLRKLKLLSVSFNNLNGSLPSEWSELSQLVNVRLDHNQLNGTIPASYSSWSNVSAFIAANNHLTGSVPNISSWPFVSTISLQNNELTGTLPSEWGLATSLQFVYLSFNALSGTLPAAWANLSQLLSLVLSSNRLSGSLPPEWSSMLGIEYIELASNLISGTLPSSWSSLMLLDVLVLTSNLLNGELPATWSLLNATLYLGGNGFSGGIPDTFIKGNFTGSLMLSSNSLELTLPREITSPMRSLQLTSNPGVRGAVPEVVNAKLLDLSYTSVEGPVPCVRGDLKTLLLDGTDVSSLPSSLNCTMPNVKWLSVTSTKITSLSHNFSAMLPNVETFSAANNNIRDEPMPLFADGKLAVLDLSGNLFSTPLASIVSSGVQYVSVLPLDASGPALNMSIICPTMQPPCALLINAFIAVNTTPSPTGLYCPQQILPDFTYHADDIVTSELSLYFAVSGAVPFTSSSLTGAYTMSVIPLTPIPDSISMPQPSWNNSFVPIPPLPSRRLVLPSLRSAQLLHAVAYQLEVTVLTNGDEHGEGLSTCFAQYLTRYLSNQFTAAMCSDGLAAVPFTTACASCPTYATCNGSVTLVTERAAWRPSSDLLPLVACDSSGNGCIIRRANDSVLLPRVGNECAEGYVNPMCAVCDDGYGRSLSSCESCWPAWANTLVLSLILLFGLGALTLAVVKSTAPPNSDPPGLMSHAFLVVKLLSNYFSLCGVLMYCAAANALASAAKTTLGFQQSASSTSLLTTNYFACLFPDATANAQFVLVVTAVPVLVALECILLRVLRGRWAVAATATCVLQLLYATVSSMSIILLRYDTIQFYDAANYLSPPPTGLTEPIVTLRLLGADRRITFDTSSTYYAMAWGVALVNGIGVPAVCITAYRHFRKQDATESVAQHELQFLVKNYTVRRWYWEIVIMLRKFASLAAVVALGAYPVAQLQAFIAVIVAYTVANEQFTPHRSPYYMAAERCVCLGAVGTANVLLFALAISSGDIQTLHTTSAELSSWATAAVIVVISCASFTGLIVAIWRELAMRQSSRKYANLDSTIPVEIENHEATLLMTARRSNNYSADVFDRDKTDNGAKSDRVQLEQKLQENVCLAEEVRQLKAQVAELQRRSVAVVVCGTNEGVQHTSE